MPDPGQQEYDYLIAGAGCAGLSLVIRMIQSGQFADKRILLVDKEQKNRNDRTWCFWEKEEGFFEHIVFRQWPVLDFLSDSFTSSLSIAPYRYKMIRGRDFYNYCFNTIEKQPNISICYGELEEPAADGTLTVKKDGESYRVKAKTVFNSIYRPAKETKNTIRLLQHFKGWVIKTEQPSFDTGKAILMDFRIPQPYGTAFVYVLPFNDSEALVEYTLFTKELLQPLQYDEELKNYIGQYLHLSRYQVAEEEFGIIPMTNERFHFYKNGMFHIGTAGGQTKASSGYTFQFIQKQTRQIVDRLLTGGSLQDMPATSRRFRFYDNTLLHVLYHEQLPGRKVFTDLFQKNEPRRVLRFLDNESSLKDELNIISSLPVWPFLKAALKQL